MHSVEKLLVKSIVRLAHFVTARLRQMCNAVGKCATLLVIELSYAGDVRLFILSITAKLFLSNRKVLTRLM